jgi:hypothetical protein
MIFLSNPAKEKILKCVSEGENLYIDGVDGSQSFFLSKLKKTFNSIDVDLRRLSLETPSVTTSIKFVEVYQLTLNACIPEMFFCLGGNIKSLSLTEHQIVNFMTKFVDRLDFIKGSSILFLFENRGQLLVAHVIRHIDKKLVFFIRRFGDAEVLDPILPTYLVAPSLKS